MSLRFSASVLLAALFLSTPAQAQIDDLFRAATSKLHDSRDDCAYTVVTTTSEETLVASYDPSRADELKWQLISVDGEPPSDKRVSKYRKQKEGQEERNGARGFSEMVDESSVERIEETAEEVTYRFQPIFFADKPEQNKLMVGLVIINKNDASIRQMEYYNTAKVKPVAIVTIEKLHSVMEFTTMPDGEQVPLKTKTHTKGKAFVFKKFDEHYVQEFSDYRKVSD